jgi:hypothetical protein
MGELPLRGDRLFGKVIQMTVQNFSTIVPNNFYATLVKLPPINNFSQKVRGYYW